MNLLTWSLGLSCDRFPNEHFSADTNFTIKHIHSKIEIY